MSTTDMDADNMEDFVMNKLPLLDAEELGDVCDVLVDVQVEAGSKDNKKKLYKLILKYIFGR